MTDFIDLTDFVEDDNSKNEEKDDEVSDSDLDSSKSFIDDNDETEKNRRLYRKFENVTTSIDDVLKEEYERILLIFKKLMYLIFVKHLKKK